MTPDKEEQLTALLRSKTPVLASYGIDKDASASIVAAALTLERAGAVPVTSIWNTPMAPIANATTMRDEFQLVVAAFYWTVAELLRSPPKHDYGRQYSEAFSYISKSVLESARGVDALVQANCYVDALSICRTLCSRLNLLLVFALNPALFDDWLVHPTDDKYLDGRLRNLLASHQLEYVGQLYDELSEAIHLHDTILVESGYLSTPIFSYSEHMAFRVYAVAKLLVGRMGFTGFAMLLQDHEKSAVSERILALRQLWTAVRELLAHNRIEHLFTVTIVPDRHVRKVGKDRYLLGMGFDFDHVTDQLGKFHRERGQRKRLQSPYA